MKNAAQLFIVAALLTVTAHSPAAPEDAKTPEAPILSSDLSGSDLTFFSDASRQILLIARISYIAKAHAVTPEIQSLAAAISTGQTASAARLKDLADRKSVPFGDEPNRADKALLKSLSNEKGAKLDKSYLDALSDAQSLLAASLQAGVASADSDIKSFAQAALDTLKQEQARVRKLGL
jgi:hypothetical protein